MRLAILLLTFFLLSQQCCGEIDGTKEVPSEDAAAAASSQHGANSGTNGNTDHDGGSEPHGVRLASWRWTAYRPILVVLIMILMAGILKLLFHHSTFLSRHLPESCVLIIIGVGIGFVVDYGLDNRETHIFPEFTNELFFNVLLPPIILDAAYSLYDRSFLANIGSVVLFAVMGTLFNVFAIGGMIYLLSYLDLMGGFATYLDPIHCLLFSSLISAVDPVAVLAIFEEIGVNLGLYFLVFGESLLNDGVTVVLYNTMGALVAQETVDYMQYVLAFFSFFTVVFGGLLVGTLVGALSAFILKFCLHTRVIEPLIVFVTSYLAYILAETFHWSGILSLIGCGIMQKRYAFPNISKKSYTTVKYSVKTLASFSDCIIFLFLGIVLVRFENLEWHTGFVLWTVGLCLVVRFLGVFGLSWCLNQFRIKPISYKEQFIMAYGGLRGAVGFSLVSIMPEADPFKKIFLTTTLVMILFTVFVQGGTIKMLVDKLRITKKTTEKKMICNDVNEKTMDHVMAGIEVMAGKHSMNFFLEALRNFDNNYTKKWLIRKGAEDLLALRFERITLDEHYARLYGPAVMIHQRHHAGGAGASSDSAAHEFTARERRNLKKALSNTPFERYRAKAYMKDSPEHLQSMMRREHEERLRQLKRNLSDKVADTREEMQEIDERAQASSTGAVESEKRKLMWKRSFDATMIKQQYLEAKEQFKKLHGDGRIVEEGEGGDNGVEETKV